MTKMNGATVHEQSALIVYEDALLRDLVQNLLETKAGYRVVNSCHVSTFSTETLRTYQPAVVVADRMTPVRVVTMLEAIAQHPSRVRMVSVNLVQEDLYVIEVEGRRRVGVEEFVDAVQTSSRELIGEKR
ncbi:MAG: hypothetical protein U0556_18895 [Dehalococcoidia bacterium]